MREQSSAPILTQDPFPGRPASREGPDILYIGGDLHRKVSNVVPLDEAGNVDLRRGVVNDSIKVHPVSGDLEPNAIEVALNATYGRAWFADASVAAHVAHTQETKASASSWVKNDAFRRLGRSPTCWGPSRSEPAGPAGAPAQ